MICRKCGAVLVEKSKDIHGRHYLVCPGCDSRYVWTPRRQEAPKDWKRRRR